MLHVAKYSIIIPLYNKGIKIRRTIGSVLNQGVGDLEIVVVDDGSTDNSAEYVKAYDDPRIRYMYKKNGGVSSARNAGLRAAMGEWLILLDADDELLPGALEEYDRLMGQFPNAAVLVQHMDWNRHPKEGCLTWLSKKTRQTYSTSFPFLHIWLNLCFPCPGAYCFRKSIYKECVFFDERLSFWEDFDFARRLIRHQTIAISTRSGARYNQEATGLSGTYHPLECEMAYYIPEIITKERTTFGERLMLYEIIGHHEAWWNVKGDKTKVLYYINMQGKYFAWYYQYIHWIRQKMTRYKLI